MANEIKIGKYTLESLTTGMYSDPKIIYREYIQNAVDSLDEALNLGYESPSDLEINIIIEQEANRITISDNGTGIRASQALKILTDIGNSKKKHTNNRGFRGIGRLGGLSYCKVLTFTTSFKGEAKKTIVSFDCKRLKELLIPGQFDDFDLQQVINDVTTNINEKEDENEHYFRVDMEGVDVLTDLLSIQKIESYIKQVAPLPYDKKFKYSTEIKKVLKNYNMSWNEYSISIGDCPRNLYPIFKPNVTRFIADATKNLEDEISKFVVFEIKDYNEQPMAIGWYGDCAWYGSVVDKEISGLRVRKGNILIGDSKTLNPIFKEERFNGWTQGEVFILSDKLIPNARRDDFEQNEEYSRFLFLMSEIVGSEISRKIRKASKDRNSSVEKKAEELKKVIKEVETINKKGFNSEIEKKQVENKIKSNIDDIGKIKVFSAGDLNIKHQAIEDLSKVLEKTKQSQNFKVAKINRIGDKELEVLKVVSNILTKNLTKENVDMILDEIIKELNGRGKRN